MSGAAEDYADRLWDFDPVGSPQEGEGPRPGLFRLRQASSEAELLENRRPGSADQDPRFRPPGMGGLGGGSSVRIGLDTARDLGTRLWTALPDSARALVGPPGTPLRLKISSRSEQAVGLPWECLTRDGVPLALAEDVRITRSVPMRYSLPPVTVTPPLRVLIALTNPKDERLLNAGWEIQSITPEGLDGFDVQVSQEPTPEALQQHLQAFQPHVVHYVGHSGCESGQGYLILHDERQHSHWLGAAELATLLPSSVRVVCLSTCFTVRNYDLRGLVQLAHARSDVALPSVVANVLAFDTGSQPAIRAFWTAFYTVLLEDSGDLTSAVHQGRLASAAAAPGFADFASFALVIRDGTGWGLRVLPAALDAARKEAELEALFTSRLANALSVQSATLPVEAQETILKHSRAAAQAADDALSSFGGYDLPRVRKR